MDQQEYKAAVAPNVMVSLPTEFIDDMIQQAHEDQSPTLSGDEQHHHLKIEAIKEDSKFGRD